MITPTRDKLLASAIRCFADQGFHATSVGQIARSAGVSQGAMYNHFPSKDALIVALVEGVMEAAQEAYSIPVQGSLLGRVQDLVLSCISLKDYPIDAPLWVEILAETGRNLHVRTAFLEADRSMRRAMTRLITHGVERGAFATRDPAQTTLVLFALIDGLIARRAMDPGFDVAVALPNLQHLIAQLLNSTEVSEPVTPDFPKDTQP